MALQINGTTVINNFRQLENITGADVTTINALKASGLNEVIEVIRTPIPVSPLSGASNVLTAGNFVASPYAPAYSGDTRDFRQFQVSLSSDPQFLSPIIQVNINADSLAYNTLSSTTAYIWRCRDKSVRGDFSEYMTPQTFTTAAQSIIAPSITSPTEAATGVSRTQTFTSSAFSTTPVGFTTHASSDWQFSVFSDFSVILHESLNNTSALTSYTIPAGILNSGTVYYARVRHRGASGVVSSYSATRSFTTLRTNTPSITSPSSGAVSVVATGPFTSSAFSSTGSDTHQSSTWQFSTLSDFSSIAHQSTNNTSALTSYSPPSGALNSFQSYFVRVLHTGTNGGPSQFSNGVSFTTQVAPGQQQFTSAGTFSFVVPAGVTSISAVAVGGGGGGSSAAPLGREFSTAAGGGGGGLAWNTFSVTPGETLTVTVGSFGPRGQRFQTGGAGGTSSITRNGNMLVGASGGQGGGYNSGGNGGTVLAGNGGTGGRGGDSLTPPTDDRGESSRYGPGAGGGAAGYTGNGGFGGRMGGVTFYPLDSGAGSGGGGGGGLAQRALDGAAGGGGGVGIHGQGTSGRALIHGEFGTGPDPERGKGGIGGSGGSDGANGNFLPFGGAFGGGGGAGGTSNATDSLEIRPPAEGSGGAVRIIWPAPTRQYPNTLTQDM